MRIFKSRRVTVLERTVDRLAPTSFARALGLVSSKPPADSGVRIDSGELTEPYVPYDEFRRVRCQLLELERQRAEAIDLARRRAYL